MQIAQFHRLIYAKLKRRNSFAWSVLLAIFATLPLITPAARPQNPGVRDTATQAPKSTSVQPADKQPVVETKAQLQQKQLAEDTAKLFELANELKADMDKTTKDTLSLEVVKKAEQVEKLAHKVREEMKASIGN